MDMLADRDWEFPVDIHYGPGRARKIVQFCEKSGISRPLVVTDKGSCDLPYMATLMDDLRASFSGAALFADISPNPLEQEIYAGKDAYHRGRHNGIIAIGGGSGMDGGKAISLIAHSNHPAAAFNYDLDSPTVAKLFPPLICIPTTAGTGAETDSTAMLTDAERGIKYCAWHPQHKPRIALLDPALSLSLPTNLTAWTGLDALIHALEAYCVPDFHPLCDGIALESLRLNREYLVTAVNEPDNMAARGGMLVASCLGGVAFIKGLGLVHAISHMVGADYNTHHGLTNAILLPTVLRFNADSIAHKIPAINQVLGLEEATFAALYDYLCALLDELQIPRSLTDIGVPPDCADTIAAKALLDTAAGTNPRSADHAQVSQLVQDVLRSGR